MLKAALCKCTFHDFKLVQQVTLSSVSKTKCSHEVYCTVQDPTALHQWTQVEFTFTNNTKFSLCENLLPIKTKSIAITFPSQAQLKIWIVPEL